MLISISGEELANQFVFMSLSTTQEGEARPRLKADGTPKTAPSGEPTFSTGLKLLSIEDGAPTGEIRNANVNTCFKPSLSFGLLYKPAGRTWVTHYVTGGGQLGVSITCERLTPVMPTKAER